MCGPLDLTACHTEFSVRCFNETWGFLDLESRTPEQEEEMLRLAMTSHYHWTQRDDVTEQNQSIAAWLISRVFAVMGQSANAVRWAERAGQAFANDVAPPFYQAYVHEAFARGHQLAGDTSAVAEHLELARALTEKVPEPSHRKMIEDDLATIIVAG